MEFGTFHEFLTTRTGSQAEAFAQSLAQIEAAESWGLDVVWLAEIHMINSLRVYCQEVMPQFKWGNPKERTKC